MKLQIIATILALSFTTAGQATWSPQKTAASPPVAVHHPWMDEMRKQGIKRAVVWIDIRFHRSGRPKEINLNHIEYFTEYEGARTLALEKAKHGFWAPDLPRPRPHPFIGGAQIEYVDDEQHPIPHGALYYVK